MSLSQPQNQIITWFVLFHIASSATLLQLLQRDLLRLSHRGLTQTVQTELKRTFCGSKVAKEGTDSSCYDAPAESRCMWNVRSTCCKSKEDERAWSWRLPLRLKKTFLQWPHTWTWAFTVHEWLPGSRFPLYANNLLHVSHLKVFIFRWTLFVWQGRSSDMVQVLSHSEQLRETRSTIQSLWCFL